MSDPVAVVKAAYALADGEHMDEPATLTGLLVAINTVYNDEYGNITVTIVVDGCSAMPVTCFRLRGKGTKTLSVGDTITVTGTLMNFHGTIESVGCTLDAIH